MEICKSTKCTGCMACYNACPVSAITMEYNELAELTPVVSNACVSCGKCQSVCPSNHPDAYKNQSIKCYAGFSEANRESSSSGGLASAISNFIINNGGVVCGCIFDGKVQHVVSSSPEIIEKMKGSKYVHSQMNDCYKVIKDTVKTKKCLFVGTPCQVAALKNFVGASENLFCIDIVCHGVPSPKYLDEVLNGFGKVDNISFRQNNRYVLSCDGKTNGQSLRYVISFLYGMSLRESCYSCAFAEKQRVGDITLGDFWGVKNFQNARRGVSLIIVNNQKGQELFDLVKDQLYFEERTLDEAYAGNLQLLKPSPMHKKRGKFNKLYIESGNFDLAVKKTLRKERFIEWLKRRKTTQWLLKLYRGE